MSQVGTVKNFASVWSRKPSHGPRAAETRWKEMRWPWGERKPGFMQENAWRRRAIQMGREWEMPEIHERVGCGKLSLVFSSMSFRKEWGKSGKIGNRYFHSPLVPRLETANGLFLPPFLFSSLFSQQTKSCIRLLLDCLDFMMPVKSCYFLLEQGLVFFVSPLPSQMEILTPRMRGLCQYDAFKSNTLLGWDIASFHIYIRYLFPHEWLPLHLKPYYLNFVNSREGPSKQSVSSSVLQTDHKKANGEEKMDYI